MNKILFVLLVFFSGISFGEEILWEIWEGNVKDGTVTIRESKQGAPYEEVVKNISNNLNISAVTLNMYGKGEESEFQIELMQYLKKYAPIEISNALKSAGNMHNPAIDPIRRPLSEAILNSKAIQPLIGALSELGYYAKPVLVEKLRIYNKSLIQGGIYIQLEKTPNKLRQQDAVADKRMMRVKIIGGKN